MAEQADAAKEKIHNKKLKLLQIKETFLSKEYKVYDTGIVFSKSNKPMSPSINPKGYKMVILTINKKQKGVAVHTLVARAFCNGYKKRINGKSYRWKQIK